MVVLPLNRTMVGGGLVWTGALLNSLLFYIQSQRLWILSPASVDYEQII